MDTTIRAQYYTILIVQKLLLTGQFVRDINRPIAKKCVLEDTLPSCFTISERMEKVNLQFRKVQQAPRTVSVGRRRSIRRRDFLKSAALLAAPGIPAIGFAGTCTDDATLLNLGLKKQLFFDNLLVESVQDI